VVAFGRNHFYVTSTSQSVLRYTVVGSTGWWQLTSASFPITGMAANAPDDLWIVGPTAQSVMHFYEP
jgi:hypothetical protein